MTILINIDVPDVAQAEAFYVEAFGLVPARRLGNKVLELTGWPVQIYLLEKPSGSFGAALDQRRYRRHWTPVHIDVVVADLGAAVARALGVGAELERPPTQVPFGRIAMLTDPFGHGFCLIEFNASGYGALADR